MSASPSPHRKSTFPAPRLRRFGYTKIGFNSTHFNNLAGIEEMLSLSETPMSSCFVRESIARKARKASTYIYTTPFRLDLEDKTFTTHSSWVTVLANVGKSAIFMLHVFVISVRLLFRDFGVVISPVVLTSCLLTGWHFGGLEHCRFNC